jgi:adenine-specific DNA-methyltransferase
VVWRRMDRRIQAAVATGIDDPRLGRRAVVPQETCVLIATQTEDEAHYLCAVLNSEPVHRLVAAHSVRGGKGFGTPGMLDYVPIRRYDPACPTHGELAALSRAAHAASRTHAARAIHAARVPAARAIHAARAASPAASLDAIQSEIDRHVAALWKDAPTRVESTKAAKPGPY